MCNLQNVFPKKHLDLSLISEIKGKLNFREMNAGMLDHLMKLKVLTVDLTDRSLKLRNLKIGIKGGKTSNLTFKINNLNMSKMDISDLNYSLLLQNDSIVFGKLIVNGLRSDIVLLKKNKKKENQNTGIGFLKKTGKITYDSIRITHLFTRIHQTGDSANSVFRLSDLNFAHIRGIGNSKNLIKNLRISFDSLLWADTLNNVSLMICYARNDPYRQILTIEDIVTENLFKKRNRLSLPDSGDFYFHSNKVVLSGIQLSDFLPARLSVEKLTFDRLKFFLIRKNTETAQKANLELNMGFIRGYANLVESLKVSLVDIKAISFQLYREEDTISNQVNFKNVALQIKGINIDTTTASLGIRNIVKKLTVDLQGKSYITPDSMYEIQSGLIRYNFPERIILVDSFYVMPRYPMKTFF